MSEYCWFLSFGQSGPSMYTDISCFLYNEYMSLLRISWSDNDTSGMYYSMPRDNVLHVYRTYGVYLSYVAYICAC